MNSQMSLLGWSPPSCAVGPAPSPQSVQLARVANGIDDIVWLHPDGRAMEDGDVVAAVADFIETAGGLRG